MVFNIVGVVSAIGVGFASYSYFYEKFEAQRSHSLVLEAKLNSQEKLADERLKNTEEKFRSQQEIFKVQQEVMRY